MQDPAIKLFGKKIPLSLVGNSPPISRDEDVVMNSIEKAPGKDSNRETEQDPYEETPATNEPEDEDQQKETNPDISSDSVDPKTPSIDEDTATGKAAKDQIDSPDSSPEKEKALKKPDKILPCPRCNSMDTKFCYYNNYNVNQPRHFCKACQRYWTAGGTMRNVPVGAGRRKSKSSSSASRYRHLNIPEAFQVTHGVNHHHHHHQYPDPRTHGTVLSFGSDSCDHMTVNQKNGEDCSSESTVTTISPPVDELGTKNLQNLNGLNVPTFPWPYNMAVPFYPGPAFWTCNIPTPWNIPCLSSPSQNPQGFGPNSQVLGKHLREGDGLESDRWKKNGSVLIPKTLRIDDPSEAAKSSIWATLGIKNEGIATKGGIFKAFKPMFEEKTRVPEPQNPAIICANPAALSRSLKFHESH